MKTEDYKNFETEDFIHEDKFLKWILHPDDESYQFWSEFLLNHPDKTAQIEEAIQIIRSLQPVEPIVTEERLDSIFDAINHPATTSRIVYLKSLKYAAAIILLISIGGIWFFNLDGKHQMPDFQSDNHVKKGQLILADGTIREFETDQTSIHQTSSNKLTLNNDTIIENTTKSKSDELNYNQVIIPYGKRSEILLADGTHIFLNSGSKFSYPTKFAKKEREVYLTGEAFFNVKSDPDKPFYVITENMKIKVLGTSFNVSCYENDPSTQAVLLSGKITASKNKAFTKYLNIEPGERILFDKNSEELSVDKVDVNLYSSWINGYLIFRNEPVSSVFRKLERYYNQKIVMEQNINDMTFSGKLDLIENVDRTLENIAFTSAFKILRKDSIYLIK